MPEYIIRIEGKFNPHLAREHEDFAINLTSFVVTVEKETVTAIPHAYLQMEDRQAACELLQQEFSPLLTVLGSEEGQAIELEITDVVYPALKTSSASIRIMATIGGSILTAQELLRKIHWASVDPIYRDLLDFYTEAQAAPNPRPAGAKLVERLKVKFNGYDNALTNLGMLSDGFNLIKREQSKYKGDRHADYKEGYVPARLSPTERNEILTVLKQIIHEYENRICVALP
jgi:hypothetical protein